LFRTANHPYSRSVNALPTTILDSNPTVIVMVIFMSSIAANVIDKYLTMRNLRRGGS
jgi:hypothetical protein